MARKRIKTATTSFIKSKTLLFSQTMNKIKRIINHHYAYIVPSTSSIDYVSLCFELKIPLYSGSPQ
jgi:hypothetical protein